MGVYIKGMKMPESCTNCERWADCSEVAWYMGELFDFEDLMNSELNKRRHDNCPLVEVPTPHGRLVDAGELLEKQFEEDYTHDYIVYADDVDDAPTVIEAEKE